MLGVAVALRLPATHQPRISNHEGKAWLAYRAVPAVVTGCDAGDGGDAAATSYSVNQGVLGAPEHEPLATNSAACSVEAGATSLQATILEERYGDGPPRPVAPATASTPWSENPS
jgi:hypothetical protein